MYVVWTADLSAELTHRLADLNNLGTVLNTLWLSNPASGSIPSAQADLVSVFSVLNVS